MNRWPLALAAALSVTLGAAVATAQTVIVRNAPVGSNVEVVVNSKTVGSATVNAAGDAVVNADLTASTGKSQIDAYIHVDVCPTVRRVVIVEGGVQPPPWADGCERRDIGGLFVVRDSGTVVVNVAGAIPTVLLRRGSFSLAPPRVWPPAPKGLTVFGGGGLTMFREAEAVACGDVSDCQGQGVRGAVTAGVVYWFARRLGIEASYLKPGKVTVEGRGEGFRFNSVLDAEVVSINGKVGFPIGPIRLYGQVGPNYHRATFGTSQTNEEVTLTIGDVTQTVPGGTQTFDLRTAGWGWQLGGGIEIWLTRGFALYGEGTRMVLKGDALDNADGNLDERVTAFLFGVRVRIGR